MNSPTNNLPMQDPYTTYDYTVGTVRNNAEISEQYEIEYVDETAQALAFQRVLNNRFNEQLRAEFSNQQGRGLEKVLKPKLKIKIDGHFKREVNALTRAKTVELAKNAVEKWKDEAKEVLNAAKTGTLYWNVIYYFGDFDTFLRSV